MKSFAFVFPGQGSQSVGMLQPLAAEFSLVEKTFAEASSAIDIDLWSLAKDGPAEKLNQTEYTQPALLAAGVAVWRVWQQLTKATPELFAGHSLGEYTALVCAESLDFADAIRLVQTRGRLMQQAVAKGGGAMAAIIGLDNAQVQQLCKDNAEQDVLQAANYNSPGQVVIAGNTAAVERAVANAKAAGAKLAKVLPVSVPSHCKLMQTALPEFEKSLASTTFKTPQCPVVNNVNVTTANHPDDIRQALAQQLVSPVRWAETIELFIEQDLKTIMECGPGKVLTGLNKRIYRDGQYIALNDPHAIQECVSQL